MKWWRIRKVANATTWQFLMIGVGVLIGVALVAFLPGMPWVSSVADATGNLDLGAQRSMAVAAWYMVVITGLSSIIGAASLLLILLTLKAAQRSAKAAEETTAHALTSVHHAEESVNVARSMGMAQVRAYVSCTKLTLGLSSGDPSVVARGHLHNSGQSPARFVSVGASIRLEFTTPEAVENLYQTVFLHDLPSGNGDDAEIRQRFPRPADPAMINFRRALVEIQVKYLDVFGEWQFEHASYLLDPGTERHFEGDWTLKRRPETISR